MLGFNTRRIESLFLFVGRFYKGMELELATMPDIVAELNKRENCPFILIFNGENNAHHIVWDEKSLPTVLHVMHELNLCQSQFLLYLNDRMGKGGV